MLFGQTDQSHRKDGCSLPVSIKCTSWQRASVSASLTLEAACVIGAIAGGASELQLEATRRYAAEIGMAFQIRDDLLDHFSTTEELGKPVGSDEENHKTTFYTLLGRESCEAEIHACTERAKEIVSGAYTDSAFLCAMADWLAGRKN